MSRSKPSMLFIALEQYGKHKNSYKHCQYLNSYYNITYICFDRGLKKIKDNTEVIYLDSTANPIRDTFKMIKASRKLINQRDYQIVFILYFMLCSLVKFFLNSNFIVDIRTGAIAVSYTHLTLPTKA